MKKYENFCDCFSVLEESEREKCGQDIYRMGVIGQFNLSFELAWKALQAVLRMHSVAGEPLSAKSYASASMSDFYRTRTSGLVC